MEPSGWSRHGFLIVLVVVLLAAVPARGQTGGGYDLRRNTIDGGGATFVAGGVYRLGGTIGQADAGTLTGGQYVVAGGFWPAVVAAATPTPTPTITLTSTPTPTRTATFTATPTSTPTWTPTHTPTLVPTPRPTDTSTRTASPTSTPTRTPTATGTPSPTGTATPGVTPTPTAGVCTGDCGGDGDVTVDELVLLVNIASGETPITACEFRDVNDDVITIDDLLAAVGNALATCP